MSRIIGAARFAADAHKGQTREVTGDPYVVHPGRVASQGALLTIEECGFDADEELVMVCWLHDVLEDTNVKHEELVRRFGQVVGDECLALTNRFTAKVHPDMKRKERKKREVELLTTRSPRVRAVKLLDRLDNLREMDLTSEFAGVYLAESEALIQLGRDLRCLGDRFVTELTKLRDRRRTAVVQVTTRGR